MRMFADVEVTEQWQECSLRRLEDNGILKARLACFLRADRAWGRRPDIPTAGR